MMAKSAHFGKATPLGIFWGPCTARWARSGHHGTELASRPGPPLAARLRECEFGIAILPDRGSSMIAVNVLRPERGYIRGIVGCP
jgi:hypothetical protein